MQSNSKLGLGFLVVVLLSIRRAESKCSKGCHLAISSYYIWQGSNLTFISTLFDSPIETIVKYNSWVVPSADALSSGSRLRIPFSCDCIDGEILGHKFSYKAQSGDTYQRVASLYYSNLTSVDWLQRFNSYSENRIPADSWLDVVVNCSCGDENVSKDYGLFMTYPLRPDEDLASILNMFGVGLSTHLIQAYNPNSNFHGSGLVYIPVQDLSGKYPPLKLSKGISAGVIAGIAVAVTAAVLFVAICSYVVLNRRKRLKEASIIKLPAEYRFIQKEHGSTAMVGKLAGIAVDKSVEFSYEELVKATNDFSLANKIGEGGFGAVYFAELRGEKAAIKRMDMQATKEFLAELKILTHVHHMNLVRLIGYCVEESLFLVYEFIDNGNLSEHLRGSDREPLPWSTRVQIALDSARGLEYIHEHTVPVYIHRDIKPANILIDHNFHGKVADFGLAKLIEVGSSFQTRLAGTFGYMPPEYAQYGNVSPKIDVFAFGVVLYELISAKEAIVKMTGSSAEPKGLVSMFEDVLNQPDPREDLCKLVDPRLGGNYPFYSVRKLAQLAKACTHENPQLRPSMSTIVVQLVALASSNGGWDVDSFYENEALVDLMPGR